MEEMIEETKNINQQDDQKKIEHIYKPKGANTINPFSKGGWFGMLEELPDND